MGREAGIGRAIRARSRQVDGESALRTRRKNDPARGGKIGRCSFRSKICARGHASCNDENVYNHGPAKLGRRRRRIPNNSTTTVVRAARGSYNENSVTRITYVFAEFRDISATPVIRRVHKTTNAGDRACAASVTRYTEYIQLKTFAFDFLSTARRATTVILSPYCRARLSRKRLYRRRHSFFSSTLVG